ncbi:hypothetical protein PPYR_06599 [Photinus pyralis]|uniref:Protein krueppel n=1 Tax=Photinus pyralis TaxID=7054 RepID=A0A1Y1MKD7_PHOPY|nr:zinc finger protein 805-like isoform X2 [Photinus pyralis]XP_031338306.1 zinc finger protein 805-like isoform X2 [Photinus pyralis]KAB0800860.1 hypothetical protein PPYR_06599 [Photinus pyralis]
MEIKCPQCNNFLISPSVRLVQDACGHKKCRMCLLQDELQCKMCAIDTIPLKEETTTESVIKCENNHTGVITCNKVNTAIVGKREEDCKPNPATQKTPLKKSVISTSPTTYKCNICNKSFKTKSHINYHSYCDGGQRPLQCSECNKGFVSKYHLEIHLLVHSNKKPHTCMMCAKSFTCLNKLNRHKLVHLETKQYVCQQCGKLFKNKDYLQRHSIIHTLDKPFGCKICKAHFNNRSNLNKHQLTHSKEKNHMCDECGKRFKFKNALTAHYHIHTKLRPYTCLKCPKTFLNAKDLHRHQLVHSDTKLYSCSLCKVSFMRKDNLQRHIRNSHPGKKASLIKKPTKKSIPKEFEPEVLEENPNAIKVITSPPTSSPSIEKLEPNKQIPVINAPVKLAFKTMAFKSHYNIPSREYQVEPSRMHSKLYDYAESVSICKKILSPLSPPKPNVKTLGNVSAKESSEICQKILTPMGPPLTNDSYFEKPPSIIRNIKFKLPPKYLNLSKPNVLDEVLKPNMQPKETSTPVDNQTYTDLKPLPLSSGATSVIVNTNSSHANEMHWRRRTLQNLELQSRSVIE